MVLYHLRVREPNWQMSIFFSALGAVVTAVVLVVIASTKFVHGAWMVIVLIPVMVLWFRATREHYRKVAVQLTLPEYPNFLKKIKHIVVLPISGLHRGTIEALEYAVSISSDVRVVYVELDPEATERLRGQWNRLKTGISLVVLPSPYRSIVRPILDYINSIDTEEGDDILTVVIPEFVTARWWQRIYHNQTAFIIRTALALQKGKVVTSVRYHLTR
jgi:hypothetical protein